MNAAALVAFSREEGVSRGKIRVFLKQVCGLAVSRKTLQRLEREPARARAAEVARICEEVCRAGVTQVDEMGKTTNGHWTVEGSQAFAALMSVRQPGELNGRNLLKVLRGLMGAPGPPWSPG